MVQLHPSHTKDKTLTNIGNCVPCVLANLVECDEDAALEMENLLENALAARTEHRSDRAQQHAMEILREYALAISKNFSERSSDEELSLIHI